MNSQNHDRSSIQRPTFYMPQELLQFIEVQARREHVSRSGFVTGLLSFLCLSPTGQQLCANAWNNNRPISQELEYSLSLFQEQLPLEEINELATASQRSLAQMLTHLVLLGLHHYQTET